MWQTDRTTESRAAKTQTWYGHADNRIEIEQWLESKYAPGEINERRFGSLADRFLVGSPKDILEIGAGSGDLSVFFSTRYPSHRYTISDLSQELTGRFLPRVKRWFGSTYNFETAFFPAEEIPFADASFDLIFIKSAVHHFQNHARAFSEIHRILRPGGQLIFFNDPVCFDIPIYKTIKDLFFAREDRKLGFNCRVYPFSAYLSFGESFSKREWRYDPVIVADIMGNTRRKGVKRYIFSVIKKHPALFEKFYLFRFGSYIFVFTK